MNVACFRLLGTSVRLSGSHDSLQPFRVMFERFAVPATEAHPDIMASIRCDAASRVRVEVQTDGRAEEHCFEEEGPVFGLLYAHILDQVTRRDSRLLCVHAAALARDGQGLAIAGPSGYGKSTLSLSLGARGYTFLSDEVAAIDRETLRLLPFPLAVGCRPGTQELLANTALKSGAFEQRGEIGKTLFYPSSRADLPEEGVPIRALFFLEAGIAPEGPRRYMLHLWPRADRLAPALQALDGVISVGPERNDMLPMEVEAGAWVAPAVEQVLADEGVMVAQVDDLSTPRPDFEAAPRLEKLRTSEGVLTMLRNLRGFAALNELSASTAGGFGGLVLDIAVSMADIGFYRLAPGRLDPMLELIDSVLEGRDDL